MAKRASLFAIRPESPGRHVLEGELSFASVGAALQKSAGIFNGAAEQVVFDLAGVAKADSAGLALLLEWLRQADAAGVELHYANFPSQLLAMARVAALDDILIID